VSYNAIGKDNVEQYEKNITGKTKEDVSTEIAMENVSSDEVITEDDTKAF